MLPAAVKANFIELVNGLNVVVENLFIGIKKDILYGFLSERQKQVQQHLFLQ